MIKVSNLTKTYEFGKPKRRFFFFRKKASTGGHFLALNDVSLEIKSGEFVSILGPSGSGKSTLMHLIGGLEKPTIGSIEVDGQNLSKMKGGQLARYRSEKVGFIFQSFNLMQGASSLNNVVLPLIYSHKKVNRKKRATELLNEVGLSSKLKNRPNQLSGGEQQRVSIARALVNDPEIILADEPTGNLDSKTGHTIFEILKDLNQKGKTVIIVTHDNSLAEKTDRIIRIKDGEIEA